ncbi:hypothetical protein [Coleofasciculus sp.]|uniref:hypothetical protein n=1 Tax=Coleofasciculus sp. TaxID=3100458 RepID=UPI003A2CD886
MKASLSAHLRDSEAYAYPKQEALERHSINASNGQNCLGVCSTFMSEAVSVTCKLRFDPGSVV